MSPERSPRTTLAAGQFELVAKALADPRRVTILEAIAAEKPCDHRTQFPVSKATISYHIKELTRAGVVEARRQGQYLRCRVRREVLQAYAVELLHRVGDKSTRVDTLASRRN